VFSSTELKPALIGASITSTTKLERPTFGVLVTTTKEHKQVPSVTLKESIFLLVWTTVESARASKSNSSAAEIS